MLIVLLTLVGLFGAARATAQSVTISPVKGLALVQTLHIGDVDRESVVSLTDVSAAGIRYSWSLVEVWPNGDTIRENHQRLVSAADLDTSSRWHELYERKEPLEHPGYTGYTIGRALYDRLRATGSGAFSILSFDEKDEAGALTRGLGFGGARPSIVRWRGTLTRISPRDEPFPLLVSGKRVTVPALHLRADLTSRGERWAPEVWILSQRDHPLILKVVDSIRVFQTVRVDLADSSAARAFEVALTKQCRLEVPGIYFEFNSAALKSESDAALGALDEVLRRHADWQVTVEGHTDSIGSARSNQTLSEQRAESVRGWLAKHGITQARMRAIGHGATEPRESNTTVEGRARNRRVELVRPCGGTK